MIDSLILILFSFSMPAKYECIAPAGPSASGARVINAL